MNRRFNYLIAGVLLLTGFIFFARPLVLAFTTREIKKRFAVDAVRIQKVQFKDFQEIRFGDIQAEKDGSFLFNAKEIDLRLRFFDGAKRNFLKVVMRSASLDIKQPQKNMADFAPRPLPGTSNTVLFPDVEVIDLNLKVQLKDLKAIGRVSFNADLAAQEINSLYLDLNVFDVQKLHLENIFLWVTAGNERGEFNIHKITYDKGTLSEVKSLARLEGKNLIFDDLSAKTLNGDLKGKLVVKPALLPEYQTTLHFIGLDISRFVEDFELQTKVAMTGKISGQLQLQGVGPDVSVLGGDFVMDPPGGRLTIKDKSFLENMASRTGVDYETLIESLQDYHYNTGGMKLFLEKDAYVADIGLDGEKGPKHFIVADHF